MSDKLRNKLIVHVSDADWDLINQAWHDHRHDSRSAACRDFIFRGIDSLAGDQPEPAQASDVEPAPKPLEPGSLPDDGGAALVEIDPKSADPLHRPFVAGLNKLIQRTNKDEFTQAELLEHVVGRPNAAAQTGDIAALDISIKAIGWVKRSIRAGKPSVVTHVYRSPDA